MAFAQFNFGGEQSGGNLSNYKSQKNVNYAGDNFGYHNCDIYFPNDTKEKHPVLIHIYGSAWTSNSGKDGADLGTVGAAALANGYIFVTPNHRSSSDAHWPSQSHDIKAVIRYMRGNAEKLGVDTSFIAISGFSSGGHLASVMGTSRNGKVFKYGSAEMDLEGDLGAYTSYSSSVDAVVDWSGPVDLLNMDCCNRYPGATQAMQMPQMEENLMGCSKSACNDKFHLLNAPTFIDPTDPPFMLVHGTGDNVVAQCQSIEFNDQLKAAGVYTEFYSHSGGHSVAGEYTGKMIDFLNKARSEKAANNGSQNQGGQEQGGQEQGGNTNADPKNSFHVYIALGQSNMWGNAKVQSSDKATHDRIKMMSTANSRGNVGTWLPAVPPMAAPGAGYSLSDNFIRVMADKMPESVTIGIIPIAVAGTSVKIFLSDKCSSYIASSESWLQNMAKEYGNDPYKRMIECAKKAQETGVIKGFIYHQGETDGGYNGWESDIQTLYNRACKDLGLDPDKTPFIAGEMLENGSCAGFSSRVNGLPKYISNCAVVKTNGIPGESDRLHFTHDGYTELGKRYAELMYSMIEVGDVEPVESTPYKGVAAKIPGKIEAENYDEGGSRVGWYDLSAGNSADSYTNTYRSDDVDIKPGDAEGSYVVGNCQKGEWMKYTVEVEKDAEYKLIVRAGEGNSDGKFSLKMDDGSVDYTVNVPKTGSWGTYEETEQSKTFSLKAGTHVLTLSIEQDWVDIDWIQFKKVNETNADEISANRLTILPNPANNMVEVVGADVEQVEVVSIDGTTVKAGTYSKVDVSDLSNGLYIVRIKTIDEQRNLKLVVKH